MDSRIKTPKVERALLHQRHRIREYVTGTLCLTDRHFIFIEPTGLKETWVLYHHILSVERQSLTTKGYPLIIETKTFQQLCLIIPRESDCQGIMETISLFAQPEKYEDLFAYQYKPSTEGIPQSSGWNLYDAVAEYGRMGVPNAHWKQTPLNQNYEMCETYSSVLFVPSSTDSTIILGSAKFRSKGRLPVLSYYHSAKNSALCRCSQPLSYITRRSPEDEAMIQAIVDANSNSSFIYLLDTRPKLNAMANKAAHKGGYENTDNYTNVHYQFYNIQNIHVMRESLQKVIEAIHSSAGVSSVLSGLENSSWLKHIHLIMETGVFISKALYNEGVSVLVHCSDGWDRTAQTCALASLLMDSYYRTIHGFMVLIEKEWLSFGHKFSIRSGHLNGDSKEVSPIFTQFLDSVWQVLVQFPTSFQFNELFLITLHDHLFSCQFGTFLGNNERERKLHKVSESTYSLWGYMWTHLDDFVNPLYEGEEQEQLLTPKTDVPFLSFWLGLYCRHDNGPHPHELWEELAISLSQQNECLEDHIKFLEQHKDNLKGKLQGYQNDLPSNPHLSSPFNLSDNVFVRSDEPITLDEENTVQEVMVKPKYSETVSTKPNNEDVPSSVPEDKSILLEDQSPLPDGGHRDRLRSLLLHIPEMNLPWHPMRGIVQCGCGAAFTFSTRKYHCSYCGSVICNTCGSYHAPLPYMATPTSRRVCKVCSKLMATIKEEAIKN